MMLLDLAEGCDGQFRAFREGRSFVESAQVIGVSPHEGEGARCSVGIRKGGNAGRIQGGFACGNGVPSHPTGEHGLAIFFGVRLQAFCNLQGISHALRRKDDEETITVRVLRGNFEGAGIAIGIGVAENVDGIIVTPVGREEFIQAFENFRGKLRKFSAVRYQRVGGQYTRSASIGQDGEPRAFGAGLPAEHFRHVEQVGDGVDPKNSRAAEGCVQHLVTARERPGVRGRGAGAASERPALITMIGLVSATSRAADRNERASPMDSM